MKQSNKKVEDQEEKKDVDGQDQDGDQAAADQPKDDQVDGEEKKDEVDAGEDVVYGDRFIKDQNIQYDFVFLCDEIKKVVPAPEWPDPDNEPLPPPVINSIQKKPPTRAERVKITNYSIWTQIPEDQLKADGEEGDDKPASQNNDDEA